MVNDNEPRIGRRKFLALAGAGAASVSLAGCTASEDPESDVDGAGGGTTESDDGGGGGDDSADSSDGGSDGGGGTNEMTYLAVDALSSFDPARMGGAPDYTSVVNFYDSLLWVKGGSFGPIANVATDWTTENDGQTWVFTLRDDITHHSGNSLTASDVAYSLDRLLEINATPASYFSGIIEPGSIEARDETTVAFDLELRYGPFLSTLVQLFVVDAETVRAEAGGDLGQEYLNNNVAGSGAYTLGDRQEGSVVVFEAFEDYWGGWEDDQFDVARMRIVSEDSTAKILMQEGDADLTSKFLASDSYTELAQSDNIVVETHADPFLWHMPMNTQKPPLDDINVRKAIVHAFDYETVVSQIMKGGTLASGPVPVSMAGHNDDLSPYEQDLDAAEAALEAADYSLSEINDIEMEIMFTSVVPRERPISLLLQNNLKQIGIENVVIKDTQWTQMLERASSVETTPHFTQVGNTAKIPTPDAFTYGMYHPSAFGTINAASYYSTEELQATLEEARRTTTEAERLAKYREAQRMIYEAYPSIYMANPAYRAARNENLGGWQFRGLLSYSHRWYDFHRIGDGRA